MARYRYTAYSITTAFVVASIAVACSLNPQPIPPGDQPGDAEKGGANPNLGDSDAATLSDDASHMSSDAGPDTGPSPPPEDSGTDASDASDDANDANDDADAPG